VWNMYEMVAVCLNSNVVFIRALMVIESCANDRAQYRKCVHEKLAAEGIDMNGMLNGCSDTYVCCLDAATCAGASATRTTNMPMIEMHSTSVFTCAHFVARIGGRRAEGY
jgi:hypothetical protein